MAAQKLDGANHCLIARKRRRRGSRSVSGRSSDQSATGRCCSVGTCSDFPVAMGTDSSGELFGNGDANWSSDVSQAKHSRDGGGTGEKEKENVGIGFGVSGGSDANGNEFEYGFYGFSFYQLVCLFSFVGLQMYRFVLPPCFFYVVLPPCFCFVCV